MRGTTYEINGEMTLGALRNVAPYKDLPDDTRILVLHMDGEVKPAESTILLSGADGSFGLLSTGFTKDQIAATLNLEPDPVN